MRARVFVIHGVYISASNGHTQDPVRAFDGQHNIVLVEERIERSNKIEAAKERLVEMCVCCVAGQKRCQYRIVNEYTNMS